MTFTVPEVHHTPDRTTSTDLPLSAEREASSRAVRLASIRQVLISAAWFGLLTGLVEGVALWALQQFGLMGGQLTFLGFSAEIIWIAAGFDLLLFSALGLVLGAVAWFLPRLPVAVVSVFVFGYLALFDWLVVLLAGRVRIWAIPVPAIGLAVQLARWVRVRHHAVGRFWQQSLPWLAGVALLAFVGIQGSFYLVEQVGSSRLPAADADIPNVLVLLVDALRADHVSSYGYLRTTSPNIDRIAGQGVLFENAYSTSSWTQPSHASLLTGRYTYEHRAELYRRLDDTYPTIGELLQSHGYRTGAFSANYRVFARRLGFGRGFHHFEDYYRSMANIAVNTVYGRLAEVYLLHRVLGVEGETGRRWADDMNGALLRWIDRDSEKPFFAFVNYFDVHDPYVPPQPYRGTFSSLPDPGGLINSYWGTDGIYVPMTLDQLQGEVDAYDGAIAYVDHHIEQLMQELRARGLADNTIIVIISDHGESFGEHGLLQHTNSLYREVVHVPLIICWPGHVPQGARVAEPVSIAALPSTLAALIGDRDQVLFPAPSLQQLWDTPSIDLDWPDPIAELAQHSSSPVQNPSAHGAMRSVLDAQWHYIAHTAYGEELYRWSDDPGELINMADRAKARPLLEQFAAYLAELRLAVESEQVR
jgi:arylsulfatase A-like enzyme